MLYFPVLLIQPDFQPNEIVFGPYKIIKRRWTTSIFDFATLATKHKLHMPYQMMDVLINHCNVEIGVEGDKDEAILRLKSLKLALYSEGLSPFITPFYATHSINDYSGINSRDSEYHRDTLPEELKAGITSDKSTVEAWHFDLSHYCHSIREKRRLTDDKLSKSFHKAEKWISISEIDKNAFAFVEAAITSPTIAPLSQSILHMWCSIESLFPKVDAELTFKIALYMSVMIKSGSLRLDYFHNVKKGYSVRSKIAHGSLREATSEQWQQSWNYVMDLVNAILQIGRMPLEDELMNQLLG